MSKPETSIIIRTFNEEKDIGNLLGAIKEQDYKDYEIVLVDSGSTDRTLEIARSFCDKIVRIESRDFTFGYSLNVGCKQANGKYLVFVSAHVLPANRQWLTNLLASFRDEKTAMVYGRQLGTKESKFSERRDFQKFFSSSSGYVNNANSAVRKDFWQERGFDEYLFGLEDIEWAKYAVKRGYSIHYEPKAAVYHIHREKWHQVFNRYRREAIAAAGIGLSYPPQCRTGLFWLIANLSRDFLASLSDISMALPEEICRFRYYQWKGTRQGWFYDKDINFNRDKYALFYPSINKAAVIKDKHRADIEEVPLPEMKPGDILIRVSYVGVCRTDLEIYDGSLGYYRQGIAKYPIIPGHEFSGVIVRIGANNKYQERFKIGEKVVGECILSRGNNSQRQEVGVINYNGAYSEFIVMPGGFIHKIPKDLDLKTACLAEPLAVVLRAVRRVKPRLKPGSRVAVIGAGSIGNFCVQALSDLNCQVTVFDKNKERLEILKDNAKGAFREIEELQKFDVIIEATGSKEVLEKILKQSKNDSTILLLGFPYGNINYNFEDLVGQEKIIIGSVGGESQDFDEALKLLPKFDTASFTRKVLPLKEFSEAWQLHRSQKYLKIILAVEKEE